MKPRGALGNLDEIKAMVGKRAHLVGVRDNPRRTPDEWVIYSGEFGIEQWGISNDKERSLIDIRGGSRYWFYNETGGFPWTIGVGYLFANYWFAFAYCSQLNAKPQSH